VQNERLAIAQDFGVSAAKLLKARKHRTLIPSSGQFYAPRFPSRSGLRNGRIGFEKLWHGDTGDILGRIRVLELVSVGRGPFCNRMARNSLDIVHRFLRQSGLVGEPATHAPRAGIVSRRGKAEVAEGIVELSQITRGFMQGPENVKRIAESARCRRRRHELCDSLGAGRADRVGIKIAFLIDQPREKLYGQCVLGSRAFDVPANFGGRQGLFNLARRRCGRGFRQRWRIRVDLADPDYETENQGR